MLSIETRASFIFAEMINMSLFLSGGRKMHKVCKRTARCKIVKICKPKRKPNATRIQLSASPCHRGMNRFAFSFAVRTVNFSFLTFKTRFLNSFGIDFFNPTKRLAPLSRNNLSTCFLTHYQLIQSKGGDVLKSVFQIGLYWRRKSGCRSQIPYLKCSGSDRVES